MTVVLGRDVDRGGDARRIALLLVRTMIMSSLPKSRKISEAVGQGGSPVGGLVRVAKLVRVFMIRIGVALHWHGSDALSKSLKDEMRITHRAEARMGKGTILSMPTVEMRLGWGRKLDRKVAVVD